MNNTISKIVKERQSIKAYSEAKIDDEKWQQVLQAIYWSPSSHGFEPYRVLIIDRANKVLLSELKAAMWNQQVITQADKIMIFISLSREVYARREYVRSLNARKMHQVNNLFGEEADKTIEKQTDIILNTHFNIEEALGDEWAMKQAYIGLSFALNAAAILEIGSSPLEGFDREKVESILRDLKIIELTERVAVAAAFGYPLDDGSYLHLGTGKRFRQPIKKKVTEI